MSQELNGTLTNSANLVGTFGTSGGGGTTNYNDLTNKPQINGVTLQGNKTTSNLNISYNDLTNKPTIPSKTSDLTNDSNFVTSSELATVATTGSYNDLTNTPTIPAAQVNSDWNSASGVSEILNKPTLAAVATSGSYSDLSGTPTIPVNSDFALSGLSDTDITTPQANQVLAYDNNGKVVNSDCVKLFNITKHYASGSSTDALTDLVTTYGTVNMMFGFDVPLGYFTGMLLFATSSIGGGYIIQTATGRLWVATYISGTFTLTEKT